MKISRFAKSIAYMFLTLIALVLSTYFQIAMHKANGLEDTYFLSNFYIFIAGAVCLGTAVYSFRSFTKRHKEYKSDSLFFLFTGILLMTAAVFTIISYGGIGDTFDANGYTAANVNIVIMTVLPAPFFIRGLFLALSHREDNPGLRRAALALSAVVAAAYIFSVTLGGMMRFVYYENETAHSPSSSETIDDKSV